MDLVLAIDDAAKRQLLFGPGDRHLRVIRSTFNVQITARESSIKLSGHNDAVSKAASVVELLQQRLRDNGALDDDDVNRAIVAAADPPPGIEGKQRLEVYAPNVEIVPQTPGQARYIASILENDLTICTGPAGTGKTYLAVAVCVTLLKTRAIRRVVLVRPAVEAGEKIGYLPGDMQAKVNPYLRPLFDAMHDMMGYDQIKRFMDNDVIEVIPLAFMRGRTLNHAAVILDEAQNSTPAQMLMFLTRLGNQSKMIVTGDDSQTDLPAGKPSGLIDAVDRLGRMPSVSVVRLDRLDIVRHKLVQEIVQAYGSNGSVGRDRRTAGDPGQVQTAPVE